MWFLYVGFYCVWGVRKLQERNHLFPQKRISGSVDLSIGVSSYILQDMPCC